MPQHCGPRSNGCSCYFVSCTRAVRFEPQELRSDKNYWQRIYREPSLTICQGNRLGSRTFIASGPTRRSPNRSANAVSCRMPGQWRSLAPNSNAKRDSPSVIVRSFSSDAGIRRRCVPLPSGLLSRQVSGPPGPLVARSAWVLPQTPRRRSLKGATCSGGRARRAEHATVRRDHSQRSAENLPGTRHRSGGGGAMRGGAVCDATCQECVCK